MEQAKGELVPGGLAMVIGCLKPENSYRIGHIVELGRAIEVVDGVGFIIDEWKKDGREFVALARHLMPIKPEADPLTQEQDKCTHA